MYSETEIETAVATGAIDRATADRLRASIASQRRSSPADEEMFRLVTGFNDIFVTIAASLVVFAAGAFLGGLGVAVVSWALAEQFTRKRRMALPSIFLLLCYAGGVFSFLTRISNVVVGVPRNVETGASGVAFFLAFAAIGCLTAGAIALHWRRFHVPITIAAAATSVAVVAASLFGLAMAAAGVSGDAILPAMQWFAFVVGLAMFAYAMRWDLQDPERVTRRSDVAFWLHLAASSLIVHPLFLHLAKMGAGADPEAARAMLAAVLALALYAALGLVALIVDRRAVLVSALFYVVVAVGVILRTDGEVGGSILLSMAVIGGLLLAMSVFWRDLRAHVLAHLPERLRFRLPATVAAGGAA